MQAELCVSLLYTPLSLSSPLPSIKLSPESHLCQVSFCIFEEPPRELHENSLSQFDSHSLLEPEKLTKHYNMVGLLCSFTPCIHCCERDAYIQRGKGRWSLREAEHGPQYQGREGYSRKREQNVECKEAWKHMAKTQGSCGTLLCPLQYTLHVVVYDWFYMDWVSFLSYENTEYNLVLANNSLL